MKKRIKVFIKVVLGKWFGAKESKIQRFMSQSGMVSFDIFDTLVKRDVWEPEHVHKLVGEEFFRETGIRLHEYKKKRMDAERKARKCSGKEEISLADIFFCLKGFPDSYKESLQKIEEETEVKVCCPDLRMKRLYEKALEQKKRIIITSDMYLREEVIRRILEKCGYYGYKKLYLSSTYNLCKSTGRIYGVIKKDYDTAGGRILHIGDNFKSDFLMAWKNGLHACLVDGRKNNLKFWKQGAVKESGYEKLYTFMNNHANSVYNDAGKIGYEILGPLLLGYCKWLKEKIEKDKIDKIFFLSREGKILQEAFNRLYPDNNIPQTYLYVSRQSLLVPLIADARNFDEMVDIIKCYLNMPVLRTIQIICLLDPDRFRAEISGIGMDEDTNISEIPSNKKKLVFSIVRKLGKEYFAQQKSYVQRYLDENSFAGNVAIADIGWEGTMQMALQQYVEKNKAVIHGYYFGVRNLKRDGYYKKLQRNGYLFEIGMNRNFDVMMKFTKGVLEVLFLNRSGSVQAYDIKCGNIIPVFAEAEYGEEKGEFIGNVQNAALDFLDMAVKDMQWKGNVEIPAEYVMSAYSNFAVHPKMSTVKIFERFDYLNGALVRLIPDHNMLYYLIHWKELKRDWNNSFCKIFFLKKIFKLNFPYYELLKFLTIRMHLKGDCIRKFYISRESQL